LLALNVVKCGIKYILVLRKYHYEINYYVIICAEFNGPLVKLCLTFPGVDSGLDSNSADVELVDNIICDLKPGKGCGIDNLMG